MMHPFWDVDLIELPHRVPPDLLMQDGRSKWLLRRRLDGAAPGLGLERRGKVSAARCFAGLLEREAPPVLQDLRRAAGTGAHWSGCDVRYRIDGPIAVLDRAMGRIWTPLDVAEPGNVGPAARVSAETEQEHFMSSKMMASSDDAGDVGDADADPSWQRRTDPEER